MYAPAFTGGYFTSFPQLGRQETSVLKFGLQKNAIDCRAGVMSSPSLSVKREGGATTRCTVDRKRSLLHRASRSPTFTTMVSG